MVHPAEYGIHFLVVAPQEYANIYSTRTLGSQGCVGLYKILFYFEAYVHKSMIFLPTPPLFGQLTSPLHRTH